MLTWKPHRHLEPARAPSEGEERQRPVDRLSDADTPLHEALRAWRNRQAKADGRPPYNILNAAELAALAEARPRTRADLLAVKGIGPGKADRFGEAILGLVAEHGKRTEAPAAEPEAGDGCTVPPSSRHSRVRKSGVSARGSMQLRRARPSGTASRSCARRASALCDGTRDGGSGRALPSRVCRRARPRT